MKQLYPRCAGLDVHKEQVTACARTEEHGRVQREVATLAGGARVYARRHEQPGVAPTAS